MNQVQLERQYRKAAADNPGHYLTFEIFARLCLLKNHYQFADDALHEAIFRCPPSEADKLSELWALKHFTTEKLTAQGQQTLTRKLTDDFHLISLSAFCPQQGQGRGLASDRELTLAKISLMEDPRQCKAAFEAFLGQHDLMLLHASEVRMLPLISKNLNQPFKDAANPPAYWPLLVGVWKKAFVENSQHLSTLKQVLALFSAHGIDCVVLKGIDYCTRFYGGLAYRPMSDLDLLINPSQIERAHSVLVAAGWSTAEPPDAYRQQFHYATSYRHFGGGSIDLHWRACEDLVQENSKPQDLGVYQITELSGLRWNSLNITSALFVTVLHGVYWNHLSPVRWVIDAALMLRSGQAAIDWRGLVSLCEKYRVGGVMHFALGYLRGKGLAAVDPQTLALFEPGRADPPDSTDWARELEIRLRPEDQKAGVADVAQIMARWQSKFPFLNPGQFVVCGGADPKAQKADCERWGVGYSPECSSQVIRKACQDRTERFAFLVIVDADTSRTVRLYR